MDFTSRGNVLVIYLHTELQNVCKTRALQGAIMAGDAMPP